MKGGQERPECAVGAVNLLRRFAIEVLKSSEPLELPPYIHRLDGSARRPSMGEGR